MAFAIATLGLSRSTLADSDPTAEDLQRLIAVFDSGNKDRIDEQLVQLRWAGITDKRLYDHLLAAVEQGQVEPKIKERFIEAMGYSGNAEVYAALERLAANDDLPKRIRRAAEDALEGRDRYTTIANEMAIDASQLLTVDQLWAQRLYKGLRVADGPRVRLAARDLYLYKYGKDSLDVGLEVVRSKALLTLDDSNVEDAMAFLCKAMGLSGNRDYLDDLVYIANAAVNDKLADYAERSAQYFDPYFEAEKRKGVDAGNQD